MLMPQGVADNRIDTVRILSEEGCVVRASLVSMHVVQGQPPTRHVHFRLPKGTEGKEQMSTMVEGPLFVDDTQLLVLSSRDERRHVLIREDGYPLRKP